MSRPRVVIIGGGFGGLHVAQSLKNAAVDIILIDKTNHHLFQPLLYQVAMAALSPGDIAAPIRAILNNQDNVNVLMGEVTDIDADGNIVELATGEHISFDFLVVAAGARHSYFGNDEWEKHAPGLKTISDALYIRERMLRSFEEAEIRGEHGNVDRLLTFVVVGAGPTGVEVAGAIAEIARKNLIRDFKRIDTSKTRVVLVEAGPTVLSSYHPSLSDKAKHDLQSMGVEVLTGTMVKQILPNGVQLQNAFIEAENIIWAAGNVASPLLKKLPVSLDRAGRAIVEHDCSIPDHPNIFVIGDAAHFTHNLEKPLPGVAQVAMQMGDYVGKIIAKNKLPDQRKTFVYNDLGSMATIGRAKAVAQIGKLKISGLMAWLMWSLVHVAKLISYRTRYKVMAEWIWYYLSFKNGIRLITGMEPKGIEHRKIDLAEIDD